LDKVVNLRKIANSELGRSKGVGKTHFAHLVQLTIKGDSRKPCLNQKRFSNSKQTYELLNGIREAGSRLKRLLELTELSCKRDLIYFNS
jgi:hypothetical protein